MKTKRHKQNQIPDLGTTTDKDMKTMKTDTDHTPTDEHTETPHTHLSLFQFIYTREGMPEIVLGISYDWSPKTCALTGHKFYPPAPMGFFLNGDPQKPVSPSVAIQRGFSTDSKLLFALCLILNGRRSLLLLREAVEESWNHEHWRDDYGRHHDAGGVDGYFAVKPAIPPEEVAFAVFGPGILRPVPPTLMSDILSWTKEAHGYSQSPGRQYQLEELLKKISRGIDECRSYLNANWLAPWREDAETFAAQSQDNNPPQQG